jgi:hypothetical protein
MPTTAGRVSHVYLQSEMVCVYVEYAPGMEALFIVQFLSSDSNFKLEQKRTLVKMVITGFHSRRPISITHNSNDSIILAVELMLLNISPVGPPVHSDFYSITASLIPNDADVVFETAALTITITPDMRRPRWVLIEQLPSAVPIGPATVQLRSPGGWESERVPVMVSSGAPEVRRTLFTGRPSATPPYTFVFAATPALQRETGGGVDTDPVTTNRAAYHDVVRHCIANLCEVTESLLRESDLESNIRFVSIFDSASTVDAASALVRRLSPNLIEPMRDRMNGFVGRYWEDPDIVYAVTASTTHTRASARFTTDDNNRPGTTFTYDGTSFTHRRYTTTPGSAAISTLMDQTGLTSIHEFCHAASDFNNGMVIDLYVDGTRTGLVVNKKLRVNATDAIPNSFGTYNGTSFDSDQNRDGLGYPSTWRSFHPAQLDTARPNLMDNYWLAATQVQACRLDGLTFEWFLDRLRTKILR